MYILEIFKAILYGIVEGVTEWLPISSTGHMVLLDSLLPLNVSPEFWDVFLVVIQLGAILAVCLLYFHKLNPFSRTKSRAERQDTFVLWSKVILAVIPAGVVGLLWDDWFTEHFYNNVVIAFTLILYGVLFLLVERRNRDLRPRVRTVNQISYQTALLIGVFQLLSLIPGTSRSGATILGGIFLGCSRWAAAEFSFFLAIPVMLGASALRLVKALLDGAVFTAGEWGLLATGSIVAFVVSVIAIRSLMDYVRKHDFQVFGWYRIVLGIVVLGFWGVGQLLAA